jgi:hypothetical protein
LSKIESPNRTIWPIVAPPASPPADVYCTSRKVFLISRGGRRAWIVAPTLAVFHVPFSQSGDVLFGQSGVKKREEEIAVPARPSIPVAVLKDDPKDGNDSSECDSRSARPTPAAARGLRGWPIAIAGTSGSAFRSKNRSCREGRCERFGRPQAKTSLRSLLGRRQFQHSSRQHAVKAAVVDLPRVFADIDLTLSR